MSASRLVRSISQCSVITYRARTHLRSEFRMETYLSLAAHQWQTAAIFAKSLNFSGNHFTAGVFVRMRRPQLRKSKPNFGLVEPAGCYLTPTESPSECISTPTECNLTPLQFMVQKWGVNQHPIFNSVGT